MCSTDLNHEIWCLFDLVKITKKKAFFFDYELKIPTVWVCIYLHLPTCANKRKRVGWSSLTHHLTLYAFDKVWTKQDNNVIKISTLLVLGIQVTKIDLHKMLIKSKKTGDIMLKLRFPIHILKCSVRISINFTNFGLGAPWDRLRCINSFAFMMVSFLLACFANGLQWKWWYY